MTDPTDIAELVGDLRDGPIPAGEGPEGIELFDIEGTHDVMCDGASALERLQGEKDRGQQTIKTQGRALYELTKAMTEVTADISRLREALEAAQKECIRCSNIEGSQIDSELSKKYGFGKIHSIADAALAREHPDTGTTEEENEDVSPRQ